MYIKIGLDLGNNTTCAVTNIDNTFHYQYIASTYRVAPAFVDENIIDINGEKIQLGHKNGDELTNIDKTNRLYIKHQILWAIDSLFKTDTTYKETQFELDLGVGLPIADFIDNDKCSAYETMLNNIKNIVGLVNGREISVYINKIKVFAEGHSAIRPLLDVIPNNDYATVIHDIGFLTTDVIVLEVENSKYKIRKPITINKGINYLYEDIFNQVSKLECVSSKTELDYYIRKNHTSLRTKNNDVYDLEANLMKKQNECVSIINDISNQLGFKITTCNKIFIGGGSVLLFKILGTNWVKNHIELDDNTRYSANAKGYYLSL